MAHSLYLPATPGSEPDHAEPRIVAEQVREALERVLASREFQSSKLCQSFLRYVVENTLDGHSETLKERTIGIEVFGKPASYDPSEDAGVRVKAGEIRKRLRAFYLSGPVDIQIFIDLPSGTYIPEFRHLKRGGQPATSKQPSHYKRWLVGGFALLLAFALAMFFAFARHPASTSIDQFWAPVLQSRQPILVCTSPVPVYSPKVGGDNDLPKRVEDFRLVPDRFVAVSDVKSASQIADMLGRMGQLYKLRIGNDVSFRDMRAAPAILVGFSYTQWHEIGEHFRYSIDLSRRPFGVSQDGAPTNWNIKTHPDDPELSEDYAIVSRVLYPGTNNIIVEITGISHYGTEAATDLVTNPALLQNALRQLPAGWQKKNVQIVLHVEVVSGSPSVPTIVATHVW